MNPEIYRKVRNNPKYYEFISKRKRFTWKLSAIIFIVYYAFIMLIAFSPETLGKPIGNSIITIGILVGASIIFLSIILTRIYIYKANNYFDKLIDDIKEDIRFES